jgi:hypothetical protein
MIKIGKDDDESRAGQTTRDTLDMLGNPKTFDGDGHTWPGAARGRAGQKRCHRATVYCYVDNPVAGIHGMPPAELGVPCASVGPSAERSRRTLSAGCIRQAFAEFKEAASD